MGKFMLNKRYSKLSIASLITGVSAVFLCLFYFLIWGLLDDFLTTFIADNEFMPYVMFSYVCTGVILAIAAVISAGIDLSRIKKDTSGRKGKALDLIGMIFGSFLLLSGLIFWFLEFFGLVDIIT